jgi:hypothetical protein
MQYVGRGRKGLFALLSPFIEKVIAIFLLKSTEISKTSLTDYRNTTRSRLKEVSLCPT